MRRANANRMAIERLTGGGTAGGPVGPPGPAGAAGLQGAAGPQGPPGPNVTINGVVAGGSLNGTYPDPGIARGAVGPNQLGPVPVAFVRAPRQEVPRFTPYSVIWRETGNPSNDPFNMHSDTNQPQRVRVPRDGYYYVNAAVYWGPNPLGVRTLSIRHHRGGATEALPVDQSGAVDGTVQSGGRLLRMNAGQSVSVVVRQSRLIRLNIAGGELSIFYVGPPVT